MIVGGLLLFFLLICFTSIRIEILFKRERENDRAEVTIHALFGLIRYRLKLPQIAFAGVDEGVEVRTGSDAAMPDGKESSEGGEPKDVTVNRRLIERMNDLYQNILESVDFFQAKIRWFLSKITCEKLIWVTTLGTGDAAEAGILTGVAWSIKTTLIGFTSSYIRWAKPPELYVQPHFNRMVLETHFHSIIRFRIGHAILTIVRVLLHMHRRRKRKWQSTPFKA